MSAWLCSAYHLSLLANSGECLDRWDHTTRRTAERARYLDPTLDPDSRCTDAEVVFRMLLTENLKSLSYRYPKEDGSDNTPSDWYTGEYGTYQFNAMPQRLGEHMAASLLKQIACYEYQSCEHPEWETSLAHQFCHDLRHSAITNLPGYEDAPWGIDEPTPSVVKYPRIPPALTPDKIAVSQYQI